MRQELPAISALPVERQRELLGERLSKLESQGLLSGDEARVLKAKAAGTAGASEPRLDDPAAMLTLAGVLDNALTVKGAEPATDISAGGAATVGLAAVGGAVVGAIAFGGPGAIYGALAAGSLAASHVQ